MAKLKSTEVQRQAALEGVQMLDGYGYGYEYEMEQRARRGLVSTIYGGTSEIQRESIGKSLGL
jgi:alkylation response protein AidB-like acyl-CoA dehydrogenase